VAEPEQALFLHSLPDTLPAGITRIYAGAEFCPWRLPSLSALRKAMTWARNRQCAFTLATPTLIEPQCEQLSALFRELLPAFRPDDEILISDWGTLELVRAVRPDVTIILGRTLSGQKRDPRTVTLDFAPLQLAHFQSSSWHAAPAIELLLELGINRVELDNPLQGVAPLPPPLHGTLHHPYVMVASSRNCPFRGPNTSTDCPRPCGEVFTLNHPESPRPLLQGGNTQFVYHDQLPAELATCGIDRVVEHLELPR
jgi:hypothetical protein